MNAMRITLAGVLMIVVAAMGCSHKGVITGPVGPAEEVTSTAGVPTSTPAYRQSVELRHWLSFEATLQQKGIEGGCWYLETDKGERYEPDFGVKHGLAAGMRLRVKGYLEPWIASVCQLGPILRIVDYQVISTKESMDSKGSQKAKGGLSFAGVLGQTKQGCYFITTVKEIIALELQASPGPSALGSRVKVTGEWGVLPYSPCELGPLFVVDRLEFLGPPYTPMEY